MATSIASTDGGTAHDDFSSALRDARSAERREGRLGSFTDYAAPADSETGLTGALAWAMANTYGVLMEAARSERLEDADGASPSEPRTDRSFLFGRDEEDDTPAMRELGSFVDRWDTERVVVETPAPWETPDGMTGGNELIKALEWDDHHYSFEDRARTENGTHEKVWVIDASGVEPLREAAEAEGYRWEGGESPPTEDDETMSELVDFVVPAEVDRSDWTLEGGDEVTVRYLSKQTGDVKSKTGTVTSKADTPDVTGFTIERDDGKTNRVKTDDGEAGVYSTSQYPFMGRLVSAEVRVCGE